MKKMKRILALSLAWAAIGLMTAQAQVYPYLTDPVFDKTEPFAGVGQPTDAGGNIWEDFDGDDYPDVLIFGKDAFKLFHNNGNGAYTDTTALITGVPAIVGLEMGAAAWLDYNNDNVADLVIAGAIKHEGDSTTRGTMLFKGEKTGGVYTLTYDATLSAQLPQGNIAQGTDWDHNGARWIAVADYNGDNNDDILMSYRKDGNHTLSLYKSTGAAFELQNALVNGANFVQVSGGGIAWGQMGGKPAFLFTGNGSNSENGTGGMEAGVYKQDAAGNFSLITLTGEDGTPFGMKSGEVAWIDYDKDGKQDIVMTGAGGKGSAFEWERVYLLHNEGDTTFSDMSFEAAGLAVGGNPEKGGVCASSVAVGDLNGDGWLDLAICGEQRSNVFYNTQGLGSAVFEQHSRAFELPNIRRGSVNIVDVNKDGNNDLVAVGEYFTPAVFTNAYPRQLPRAYVAPSPIVDTVIAFVRDTASLSTGADIPTGIIGGGTAWGDYNNDGNLDLLLWGYTHAEGNITRLYENNGTGKLTDVSEKLQNFPKITRGAAAWLDYNADGRLDLVITGTTNRDDATKNAITKLFKNDGHTTGWMLIEDQYATGISANPIQCDYDGANSRIISVADYNLDGYPDILIEGHAKEYSSELDSEGTRKSERVLFLFTNVPHANPDYGRDFQRKEIRKISSSMSTWGDYNNDGYPDILFTGYIDEPAQGTSNTIAGIYKNLGNGDFELLQSTNFVGTEGGEIAWIDYDNDGWQDVLITGKHYPAGGGLDRFARLYKNNGGDGTFTEVQNTGLRQYTDNNSIVIADLNNDGFLDIAMMGWTEDDKPIGTNMYYYNKDRRESFSPSHPDSVGTSMVFEYIVDNSFLNESNFSGAISLADYNGDSKLDLLIVGERYSKMFRNASGVVPTKPAKPTGLKSEIGTDGSVTLSWDKVNDASISYGLYLYKKGVRYGLAGALTSYPLSVDTSGMLKVGLENATMLHDNTVTISGLNVAEGDFEWGVVAIGANRAVSEPAAIGKSGSGTGVSKAVLGNFKVFKRGSALVVSTDITAENAELSVFNVTGAKVWSKQGCFLGETEIGGLQQGIYFVVIRVGNGIMVEKAVN